MYIYSAFKDTEFHHKKHSGWLLDSALYEDHIIQFHRFVGTGHLRKFHLNIKHHDGLENFTC